MVNVFLIGEAAVTFKEIGPVLFQKWMQIIAESIRVKKSLASWKSLWTDTVGPKEKIVKTHNF